MHSSLSLLHVDSAFRAHAPSCIGVWDPSLGVEYCPCFMHCLHCAHSLHLLIEFSAVFYLLTLANMHEGGCRFDAEACREDWELQG